MRKRTRALAISPKVKRLVWERDGGQCVLCGAPGDPVAHYISRAQGGLGVEQNILTLCQHCHRAYDQGCYRAAIRVVLREYLAARYPDWDEEKLIYRRET